MTEPRVIIPNPRIPSLLGLLNLILGSLLLLAGLAVIGWTLSYPSLLQMTRTPEREERTREREALETKIEHVQKLFDRETDPAIREKLRSEIIALEGEVETKFGDVTLDDRVRSMKDPRIAVPFWLDNIAGLFLNGLMIAAGMGLVALRTWGRRLALQVAALKLLKVIVMTVLTVGFLVPLNVVRTREFYERIEARARAQGMGANAGMGTQVAEMTAITSTITSVGFGIIAMIYPALSLWLLNKPSVRAACTTTVPNRRVPVFAEERTGAA